MIDDAASRRSLDKGFHHARARGAVERLPTIRSLGPARARGSESSALPPGS